VPKIHDLPPALRDHLFERLRERKITAEDLYELKLWREAEPQAPDGPWYKDFGSFKVCGEGNIRKLSYFVASPPRERSCKRFPHCARTPSVTSLPHF
jgi:hypothetical protein